jgi:NACHT domain
MIWQKVPSIVWFLIGPAVIAVAAAIRMTLKKLGLEFSDAALWLFTRRMRQFVAATVNLRRYAKLALAAPATSTLQVPGLRDTTILKTDEVFVNLRLDSTLHRNETFTNDSILSAGNRIRVVGDPGSGKSSLVKRVFRDLCREGISGPRNSRLPILFDLKDLQVPKNLRSDPQRSDWILKSMREKVARVEGHKMADYFDLSLRQNGVAILLDGLDEVSAESYSRTADVINALSRRLSDLESKNIVILTMRVQFHQQIRRDFDQEFPITLHVQPFSRSDIYQFLEKWFQGSRNTRQTTRVYNELAQRPSLRELCTNPLILAMYVAHYQEVNESNLPDTRTEFYSAVADELIIRRRSQQLENRAARIARREQRYLIFGDISYENLLDFSQAANSISWSDAVKTVKRVMRLKDEDAAERIFIDLGKETGIYSEERPGETLRFMHLTFCEFFAAAEAATNREDGWTKLIKSQTSAESTASPSASSRLSEVIPFAAAMVLRGKRAAALNDVYALSDPSLYARSILETQAYDHEHWSDYLNAEREWLTGTPYQEWDEYWLTRLNLYQAVLAEARSLQSTSSDEDDPMLSTGKLFSDLIAEEKDRLIRLFSTYATDDPSAAFSLSEASGVDLVKEAPDLIISACVDPPFLALCIEQSAADNTRVLEWASILSIAGLRFTSAARSLAKEKRPSTWESSFAQVEKSSRWDPLPRNLLLRTGPKGDSMLGSAISLALGEKLRDRQDANSEKNLSRLSKVRAPGHTIPLSMLFLIGIVIFGGIAMLQSHMESLVGYNNYYSWWGVVITLLLLYSFLIPIFLLTYTAVRSQCYRTLLNIVDFNPYLRRPRPESFWPRLYYMYGRTWVRISLKIYGRGMAEALQEAAMARHESTKTEPIL